MTDTIIGDEGSSTESSSQETTTESTQAQETTTISETTTNWKESLPEDIRSDKSLESIKDIGSLAKGYVSAQKMIGNRIAIPTEDASDEAKNEFYQKVTSMPGVVRLPAEDDPKAEEKLGAVYTKLGRPESPEKYKLSIPENMEVDQTYMSEVRTIAHKAGLNDKQLQALADHEFTRVEQTKQLMAQQKANTVKFLKQEWGNQFDENRNAFKGLMSKYAEKFPDAVNELTNGYAGNNPVVLMMAAELGKVYQQNGTIKAHGQAAGGVTPDEAKGRISDIMSNKAHPYHNMNDPAHAEAVKRVQGLYKDAYPSQS